MFRIFIVLCLLFLSPVAYGRSYSVADNRAYHVGNQYNNDLDALIDYLVKPFPEDEELKARVLFSWIVYHIQYDHYEYKTTYEYREKFANEGATDSPQDTFKKRIGVCRHFARLFLYMAQKAGLEAVIVTGSSEGGRHAWNAVKIKGKWQLLDATWASRNKTAFKNISTDNKYVKEVSKRENAYNKNKTKSGKKINELWFFTDPKKMIKTHVPDNMKWSLLSN